MRLILASTSPYRAALLKKIGVSFECQQPLVNEDELKRQILTGGASPAELVQQLSELKGKSVQNLLKDPQILIISGDQLVEFNNEILGKPGDHHHSVLQLQKMRGKTHRLLTAVTVSSLQKTETHLSTTEMSMRPLTDSEIQSYLQRDKPYDCAGSYKIEEAGISLFTSITAEDFTSIQGVPMIWLCNKLKEYNCEFYRA